MRIASVTVFPLQLPLKQNFTTAKGLVGDQNTGAPHVYVMIRTSDGIVGWGEARPSPRWSYETMESVTTTIRNYFAPNLVEQSIFHLDEIHQIMDKEIAPGLSRGQPIAKAAVDMALMDAIGKTTKQPLSQLWFSPRKETIALSYLISTQSTEEAVEKAKEAKAEGYKGIDIKVGFDPARDLERVEAVKNTYPDAFLRVDANQGYTFKEALRVAKGLERIGVDVFEQPLAAGDFSGHARLRTVTEIPIALDESIRTEEDVARAIEYQACDIVVIKVTKMGGLSKAKVCGEIARAAGFGLLGGGLTESSLGLYASSHLFHALNITTPVDLNGPLFVADDPVKVKAVVENGHVQLPQGNGIGVEVDDEKLRTFITPFQNNNVISTKVFRQ